MTDKLKILKDIARCPECTCIDGACVDYKMLRQSAIDWIKKLKSVVEYWDNIEFKNFEDSGIGEYTKDPYGNIINWIIYFFNITEDDLK